MFRDLKEYQEIAKIYTEKVSKPENLEENQANRMKMKQQRTAQNKGRFEKQIAPLKPKPIQGRISRSKQNMSGKPKPMPTTAEIRAKDKAAGGTGMSNIPKAEGSAVIDGKKLNPDFGKKVDIKKEFPDKVDSKPLTKKQKFDKKFIKKDKGVGFVKRGTPGAQRAENKEKNKMRAKEMFKKRQEDKAAGKPQLSGKERAQAMAKARLAKKAEMANEEFTPYDIVLEYLLSTEQAATIEEANYVMTEMDGKTINDIVEMEVNRADIIGGTKAAKDAAAGKGKGLYTPGKGVTKDFKLDPAFKLPKV